MGLRSARPSADLQAVRNRKITDQSKLGHKAKAYLTPVNTPTKDQRG